MKKIIEQGAAVLLGICIVAFLAWWLSLPARRIVVTVPPGSSARQIAALLARADVLSFPGMFVPLARLTGAAGQMKAGTYLFSPRDSVFEIIDMLKKGRAQFARITVPEGFDSRQVAELLAGQNVVDKEKFLEVVGKKGLEGYLFPETYFFEFRSPEEKVADRMFDEFRKRYTPEMQERARELRLSERQVVTLASIIEREAAVPGERPLVSAVFHNRLKRRWLLESCATVLYALGGHKEKLTYKDLKADSPYNTYRHYGLPPGPICNPGAAALHAALHPADTADMFFVVASSGTHSFSRYYSEHLRNKNKRKK